MAFDIKEIKASIEKHSYLKVHSFDITMNTPPILQNERLSIVNELNSQETDQNISAMPRIIQVRADEAQLPSAMLLTTDNQRWGIGPIIRNPYNTVFSDVQLGFLADRFGLLYAYFYLWHNKIFAFSQKLSGEGAKVPSYRMKYRKDPDPALGGYVTDIDLTLYDVTNVPRVKYKFYDAYPSQQPGMPVSWGANDQLHKVRVAFTFQRWEMMNITAADLASRPLPTTIEEWNMYRPNNDVAAETPQTNFPTQ
jgi:hypothetical protein